MVKGVSNTKDLGVGLGLRSEHYDHIFQFRPQVSWFEAVSENFMGLEVGMGGRPLQILEQIRRDYPVVLHGVSLSIGSSDPLNEKYLNRLKALIDRIEPEWVSDHICWTGFANKNSHDLLPLPFTEEVVRHLSDRIQRVQDHLNRQILLENVSSYVTFKHSQMSEWDFITEVSERADCKILLDVNNIYVSSRNHGFNPDDFILGVPLDRVAQFHLAGHSDHGDYIVDTHDNFVSSDVWGLFKKAVQHFGRVPTLIEWDAQIPEFSVLETEVERALNIEEEVLGYRTSQQWPTTERPTALV